MANKVQFKGFRIGNGTKEVGSAETLQSALRNQGIATEGVAVLLNGGRVEEADLGKLTLRDGDVIQATVKAIGGNEGAATLTGVPVKRIKVSVYMFCSFTAGIAGILEVGWLGTITTGLGQGMELTVIAAAVIGGANLSGGIGTAFGAVVGAALIEVIRNSLTLLGISTFWQGTFVGSFIIVAVLFDRLRARGANE